MTVPEDAPQTVKWADRMAQQLQMAGSEVGTLTYIYNNAEVSEADKIAPRGRDAFERLRNVLSELDAIREEIANSTPERSTWSPSQPAFLEEGAIPCVGLVQLPHREVRVMCRLERGHGGEHRARD